MTNEATNFEIIHPYGIGGWLYVPLVEGIFRFVAALLIVLFFIFQMGYNSNLSRGFFDFFIFPTGFLFASFIELFFLITIIKKSPHIRLLSVLYYCYTIIIFLGLWFLFFTIALFSLNATLNLLFKVVFIIGIGYYLLFIAYFQFSKRITNTYYKYNIRANP